MWDSEPLAIVGANMAGMAAARALSGRSRAQVFDARGSVEWLPNIHELVSASKRPQNLRLPRAPLLHQLGHEFRVARLSRVDWRRHRLEFDDGSEFLYSRLLLCLGGVNNTFGVPGARQYSMPFKSVSDCQRIAVRLGQLARGQTLRVVLIGAGIEGVEALGELLRRFSHHAGLQVTVVDSAPRLLPRLPAAVDARLREHCRTLPVDFRLGQRVAEVREAEVLLEDGTVLPSDAVIWTGGVAPDPLLRESGLSDDSGFVPVNGRLQSQVSPTLFVAGDSVSRVDGQAWPKQAYHALDMGRVAGINLHAHLHGRPMKRWHPAEKPQLITFGQLDSFLVRGDQVLAGPGLRLLKEAIYQAGMAQLDSRRVPRRLGGLVRRVMDAGIDEGIAWLRSPQWLRALRLSRLR